jgi:hypothetical protein
MGSHSPDAVGQWECLAARVQHVQTFQAKVLEGDSHARRDGRCRGALDLEAEATVAAQDERVQFGASVGPPETGVCVPVGAESLDDVGEGEPLPGGPHLQDFPAFILVDDKGNDFFAQLVQGRWCRARSRRCGGAAGTGTGRSPPVVGGYRRDQPPPPLTPPPGGTCRVPSGASPPSIPSPHLRLLREVENYLALANEADPMGDGVPDHMEKEFRS